MKIYRTSQEQDTERAARQAAEWLQAMKSDPSLQDREEFVGWVQASQLNLREMLVAGAVEQTLAKPGLLGEFDIDALIAQGAQEDNIVPLRFAPAAAPIGVAAARGSRRPRLRSWMRFSAAAGVLLAVGLVWTGMRMQANTGDIYATGIGEEKTVQLADGSTLQLHPRAKVKVAFSVNARDIDLESGEASFAVAHDTSRPFRVHAGTSMVQAVGTHFTVNRLPSGTFVAVTEGKVKVSAETPSPINDGLRNWFEAIVVTAPAPKPRPDAVIEPLNAPVPLSAGQTARIATNAKVMQRAPLEVATATLDAKTRRLIFHDDTLADIADSFNRYNARQITVSSENMAVHRYSGVFDANDPESFLQFLECCTTLKVQQQGDVVTVGERNLR